MLEEKLAENESTKLNSQLQSVLKNSMYNSEDSESDIDDGDLSNSSKCKSPESNESLDDKSHEKEDAEYQNNNLLSPDKYFQRIKFYDSDHSEKDMPAVSHKRLVTIILY